MLPLHFFMATFLDYSISYTGQPIEASAEDYTSSRGHGHAYGHEKHGSSWQE